MASTIDVIEAKARDHGALCMLNTEQAAVVLGMEKSTLEKSRSPERFGPDGLPSIPFERVGERKIAYRLTELLLILAKRLGGIPIELRMLAVLMGEEFCRRAGVLYPSALVSSKPEVSSPAPESGSPTSPADATDSECRGTISPWDGFLMMSTVAGSNAQAPRKRGPRSRKAEEAEARRLEGLGATVRRNVSEFVSLQDWLAGAEPDDAWLFVVPEAGRPIDFTTSVICGGPGDDPLAWLTLSDYLARTAQAAEEDRAKREQAELEDDEK